MAFMDPPYNVRVRDIVGRGRVKHTEFAMASGELSRADFVEFLNCTLAAAVAVSRAGAVHFVCMDWRHVGELLDEEIQQLLHNSWRWQLRSRPNVESRVMRHSAAVLVINAPPVGHARPIVVEPDVSGVRDGFTEPERC